MCVEDRRAEAVAARADHLGNWVAEPLRRMRRIIIAILSVAWGLTAISPLVCWYVRERAELERGATVAAPAVQTQPYVVIILGARCAQ